MREECAHRSWRHLCRETDSTAPPPDWLLIMPCADRGFPFIGFRAIDWRTNRLVECLASALRPRARRSPV